MQISASFYSSSWFITLFTNALKQNIDMETGTVNESLLQLWDYFLLSGWKAITKCGLFMLTQERDKLIGMSFEEILGFIP